jgi:thiamine kinase-like enzyme
MSILKALTYQQIVFDPDKTYLHFLTPRFQASAHIIAFLYQEPSTVPVAVVKFPRIPGDDQRLRRESENLKLLETFLTLNDKSIPHVLAEMEWQDYHLLVQSVVPGSVLERSDVKKNPGHYIEKMVTWMIRLGRISKNQPLALRDEKIDEPLKKIEYWLSGLNSEWCLSEKAEESIDKIRYAGLPRIFEHGDTSAPNILIDDQGHIGVVDWELANPSGYPALDLFFFLMFVVIAESPAKQVDRELEKAFFNNNAWTQPFIERYFRELEIPLDYVRPLFVLCWTRYVAGLIDRLVDPLSTPATFEKKNIDWFKQNRYVRMLNASLHMHNFVMV